MRSRLPAALVLATSTCSAPSADPQPGFEASGHPERPTRQPALEINAARLRALTAELSGDAMEGRGTGTAGGRRAVEMIVAEMAAQGLHGVGASYEQPVPLRGSRLTDVSIRWRQGESGPERRAGPQVIVSSEAPEGRYAWTRRLVFVGYGIDNQEDWNDYAGVDVTDKLVVALVGEPDAAPFGGQALSSAGRWTDKLEQARAHGAAGCLIVHTADAGYDWPVVRTSFSGERFELQPGPSPRLALWGWLSSETFEDLIGQPVEQAQRDASEPAGATRMLTPQIDASFEQTTRRFHEHNVVGRVGSGAAPVVVVTAHWDHLGRVPSRVPAEDPIFNGAVDNASGVASMLALASALARRHREDPLAGTIYFVATAAEEQGLLGSEAFARDLPVPREWIAAAINLDGMNVQDPTPSVELVSAEHSTLDALFGSALARQGRVAVPDRAPQSGAAYRSDHVPFLRLGIPILYPTPGFAGSAALVRAGQERTARYHAVSDDFDPAWSFEGAAADTQAVYEVVIDIADGNVRPRIFPAEPTLPTR